LHFLVDAAAGPGGGAFEKHVLQNVGKARPQPFAFGNAAGVAPGLGGDDRRAVIFAGDDDQAILQRRELGARRHGWNIRCGRIAFAVQAAPPFRLTISHLCWEGKQSRAGKQGIAHTAMFGHSQN
jgi:hypothetical protein